MSEDKKLKYISTQTRIPLEIYEYIKRESERMGISQNAFLVVLLEQGKKLWEAKVNIQPEP